METQRVWPTRMELLNALDQQIGILTTKTLAAFTADERSEFNNRQQRIRDLEHQLAFVSAQQISDNGVFAGIYK